MSLLFLILCSVAGYLARYIDFGNQWAPLIIGIVLLIVSCLFAIGGKYLKFLNIITFTLNSIALGFCIRSWYMFRSFDNTIWIMLAVSVAASLVLWIFYLYSLIPGFDNSPKTFTFVFAFIGLIGYVFLVFSTNTTFLSTLGYYLLIELGFLFASVSSAYDNEQLFRNIVLSSFSVFIVAIIIAIIAIADDLDISDISFSKSENENEPSLLEDLADDLCDTAIDTGVICSGTDDNQDMIETEKRRKKKSLDNQYFNNNQKGGL